MMPSEEYAFHSPDEKGLSEKDLIKIWVIASFVMVSVLVTIFACSMPVGDIHPTLMFLFPQLYYIPIILISIWYPRYGLQCTVLLVAAFLAITTYFYWLGTPVDPFVAGINAAMYLWVVAASTLLAKEGGLLNIRYWNIFRNAGAGIFLCDTKNLKIMEANHKMADLLGYDVEELHGLPASELWVDPVEGEAFFTKCNVTNPASEQKAHFLTKSGEIRSVELSCRQNSNHFVFECTAIDVSRSEQVQADLLESKERLQNLVNSSQDLIFMQDQAGRFLQFHWAKADEYGIVGSDVIGTTPHTLFPREVADQQQKLVEKVMNTGETVCYDFYADLGGMSRSFSMMLGPVVSGQGGVIGVIGTMREISDHHDDDRSVVQLERELDRWRNFINTAAHELRTPLQPILGYLHLILEDPSSYALDSETVKLLRLCLENVERERRVVDRMLELGIMDSCKVNLNCSEIHLRQLVNTVVRIGGYDHKAEIEVEVPPDAEILADRDRMYHVIDGLISNAVQYSDPPRNVGVSYWADDSSHFIKVKDNGRGIDPKSHDAIFEPFYLADMENLSREYGRMGLGLSIARRYIEMHGGRITVESEMGLGSAFTVQIPREVNHVP